MEHCRLLQDTMPHYNILSWTRITRIILSYVGGGILNVQKEIVYMYSGTILAITDIWRIKVSTIQLVIKHTVTFSLTRGIKETMLLSLCSHWNNHAVEFGDSLYYISTKVAVYICWLNGKLMFKNTLYRTR